MSETLTPADTNTTAFVHTAPEKGAAALPGKGGCRFCGEALRHSVVDLGTSPLCENS